MMRQGTEDRDEIGRLMNVIAANEREIAMLKAELGRQGARWSPEAREIEARAQSCLGLPNIVGRRSRNTLACRVRWVVWGVLRRRHGSAFSFGDIGEACGGYHPTTVLHGLCRVAADAGLREIVERLAE